LTTYFQLSYQNNTCELQQIVNSKHIITDERPEDSEEDVRQYGFLLPQSTMLIN